MFNPTSFESSHFEYFRNVCAKELVLYFENELWESLVLRTAHTEPTIYHATLAIAALSRSRYFPMDLCYGSGSNKSAVQYAMAQYGLAIGALNRRLDKTTESAELAVLSSILFINIEFFHSNENHGGPRLVLIHLQGGLAVLQSLKEASRHTEYLESALLHIRSQVDSFDEKDQIQAKL